MASGWSGLLGFTGVWPSSQTTKSGFRSVGELVGTWVTGSPSTTVQGGWRSNLALSGVWIDAPQHENQTRRGSGHRIKRSIIEYEEEEEELLILISAWLR